MKLYRSLKTKRAIDVPHLVNTHCVRLAGSIFVNIISRRNSVREFSEFDRDLKKISVDSLLEAVYHSFHRGSDPR